MPKLENIGVGSFSNNLISEVYLGVDLTNLTNYGRCPTPTTCYDDWRAFSSNSLAGNNMGVIYDFTGHTNNYATALGGSCSWGTCTDNKGHTVIISTTFPYNVTYDNSIISLTGSLI